MPYKDKERQHLFQNLRLKKRRLEIDEYKTQRGCDRCGYRICGAALHFHHRDPEEKLNGVAVLLSKNAPMQKVFDEIAKCDLLCANCHAELHSS